MAVSFKFVGGKYERRKAKSKTLLTFHHSIFFNRKFSQWRGQSSKFAFFPLSEGGVLPSNTILNFIFVVLSPNNGTVKLFRLWCNPMRDEYSSHEACEASEYAKNLPFITPMSNSSKKFGITFNHCIIFPPNQPLKYPLQ